MGKLEYLLSKRSDAAHRLAIPATAACWICLDGEEDGESDGPLVRNCGCRGDSGYFHIKCIARYAETKEDEMYATNTRTCYPWTTCVTCLQPYMGKVDADLAHIHYERYKNLDPREGSEQFQKVREALEHIGSSYLAQDKPEKALRYCKRKYDVEKANIRETVWGQELKWFEEPLEFANTCNSLGGCYLKIDQLDDAMRIFEEGLQFTTSDVNTRNYSDNSAWAESFLLNSIAEVHAKREEFEKAVRLRKKVLVIREKADGKDSFGYAEGCFSLGCVLINTAKFDEGIDYVKQSKEIAMREMGPLHQHVLKCDALLTQMADIGWIPSDPESSIAQGMASNMAIVHGLISRSDLNGRWVQVSRYDKDTGRYKAIVPNEGQQNTCIAIKPNNLIFDEGVKVVLRGLVSASDLNGKRGEVVTYYNDLERYAVRLCDESDKEIRVKPENAIAY